MAPRKKTVYMLLLEATHDHRDIREIMLDEFKRFGTEKAAAEMLGITQQTFNQWKFRLGLDDDIENVTLPSQ